MRHEFETPETPRLRGGIAGGEIEIATADTARTVVEVEAIRGDLDNLKVEQRGRDVVIEQRKRFGIRTDEYRIRIQAPHGTAVDLNVASADVHAEGRFGGAEVNTASGDLAFGDVDGDVKVRSASGDVRLGTVAGKVDVTTASGDLDLGSGVAGVAARSASGDVHIAAAGRRVVVHTASGDLVLDSVAEGSVDLKSASGDLHVGIAKGSRLHVDVRSLSGETSSEVELDGVETETGGPLVELKAATMSGDVRIVRA